MWFKGKQDSIKAGWLTKMGGGTSTLGRKNWKRRYMTLRMNELAYMPSEDDTAPKLGVVDVLTATEISLATEDMAGKENCFQIVTPKRTYMMFADSKDEAVEWVETLNTVRGKTLDQLKDMMAIARVDARNAQVGLSHTVSLSLPAALSSPSFFVPASHVTPNSLLLRVPSSWMKFSRAALTTARTWKATRCLWS